MHLSGKRNRRPWHCESGRLGWLAVVSMVFWLTACAGPAKTFYVLSSGGQTLSAEGPAVGVGPVALAGHLDRPNLVFMEGQNRLVVAESHRWAGDLADNVAQVMAVNVGGELGSGRVQAYPWGSDGGLRAQVTLDIHQLQGNATGDAVVSASWRIYALPQRTLVRSGSWSGVEPLHEDGYEALVAAESRLLERLAREIAGQLRKKF